MEASTKGYISTVSVLLSEGKANPNITDMVQLHYACWTIVTWYVLLQHGETALHKAATWDHLDIIKLLLDYHAKVDLRKVWFN